MKIYHAIVIEQSLEDNKILDNFKILNTKHSDDWNLHILEINDIEDAISKIQPAIINNEPYYWHIYDDNNILIIVYKNKIFNLDPKERKTWIDAQNYGAKLLNIPANELDFFPTQFSDESEWLSE